MNDQRPPPLRQRASKHSPLSLLGPGILVAATGVGAGDLATATFTGANLGCAVLWAVLVGSALKYVLNEGLTRWQLATGTTLLEGTVQHLGRPIRWFFMAYLLIWSYLVAMALMSACGVAAQAIWPVFDDATTGKIVFGIVHSLCAAGLVWLGGYQLFEKVMGVCIGIMFVVVVVTAAALRPPWWEAVQGLLVPTIPKLDGDGLAWTIALLGGVGGTVTVLCYGYWIREEGRNDAQDLRLCRLDLGIGYTMTAVFGLAMVIIGSQLGALDARGANLIVEVASTLEDRMGATVGPAFKWAFLVGAWGAFFSSLLGVWQSVPYLFADFWRLMRNGEQRSAKIDTRSGVYRAYLLAIAVVPISGLFLFNFSDAMKINGMVGAVFIPMLGLALLLLNSNPRRIGRQFCNSRFTSFILCATLLIFLAAGGLQISNILREYFVNELPVDVGETPVESVVVPRQPLVVETQQV